MKQRIRTETVVIDASKGADPSFGVYATDEIALTPEPFNAHLGIDLAAAS